MAKPTSQLRKLKPGSSTGAQEASPEPSRALRRADASALPKRGRWLSKSAVRPASDEVLVVSFPENPFGENK